MPRPLDPEKNQRILQAAIRTFGEKGYDGTGIIEISRVAGLSCGTVYTYFRDKETLFVATVNEVWDRFFRQMAGILAREGTFYDQVGQLIDHAMQVMLELQPLVRGMLGQAKRLDLVNRNLERFIDGFMAYLDRVGWGGNIPGYNPQNQRATMKMMVAGALFNLGSVSPERMAAEVEEQRTCFRQLLERNRLDYPLSEAHEHE